MTKHLVPNRHPQQDFFIADIIDASFKDDLASMEHPIFALKAGDTRIRKYEYNNISIEVQSTAKGLATIHDKDIWIYCISQLMEAINRGRENISRTVQFTAYDFLVTTNRGVNGRSYERMTDAMRRLKGTVIETNIETDGKRERAGFGLIDSWKIIERDSDNRMIAVEVTLPDWLFRSINAKHVLTLSPDYFRLRKPLDRRIYELARKHCGHQSSWEIHLKKLYEKTGSTSPFRNFKVAIKSLAESNELPDYRVSYNDNEEKVSFYSRGSKGNQAQIKNILKILK